ncbi:putative phage tail protein [Azospirillum soli]|uniref:putative phage tail protein n=1 Tax=Azospirillum soli TaxID=1304799 RepID=UPI001AE17983|nr:putative phage tail protein [Azospirillum soli]MBP2314890.1 uncharacterized protein YmfQ (DUF2313 family) [Azospirillum soli]
MTGSTVMQATAGDYYGLLLGLRPVGPAWPEDDNLLRGAADGLARLHARTLRLIDEADPRTTAELLPAWEAFAGLPDSCTAGTRLTLGERRSALVGRLTARGGQSRRYFQELAAAVGFPDATVTEFRPFRVDSRCTDAINPDPWRFAWLLSVPDDGGLADFDAGSPCTSAVRAWGRPVLECAVRRVQPAHAHVFFGYGTVPRPERPDEDEGDFVMPQAGIPQQSVATLSQGGAAVVTGREVVSVRELTAAHSATLATPEGAISGGSGLDSQNSAESAFDGRSDTLWASLQTGAAVDGVAWIGQRFATPQSIRRIALRQGRGMPLTGFLPQYSDDGVAWTTCPKTDGQAGPNLTMTIDLLDVGAHLWWRLLAASSPPDGYPWEVADVQMMALRPVYRLLVPGVDYEVQSTTADGAQSLTVIRRKAGSAVTIMTTIL